MNRFSLLFFALIYCFNVFNQESKMAIGLEISPSSVDLYGESAGLHDPRLSYSVGLSFDYRISERLSFKSGLNWDRKGSKLEIEKADSNGNVTGTKYEIKRNYNYLILPVLASFSNNKKNFYLNTGPFAGYLISQKDKYQESTTSPEIKLNEIENSNRIDFGWIFGLGYMHSISEKLILEIGLEEELGLLNTSKNSMGSIKTNSLSFHIGIKLKL